ncbi:MAG: Nramp family divalent metal transporter, partial [Fervidicoccaceae archaeon]
MSSEQKAGIKIGYGPPLEPAKLPDPGPVELRKIFGPGLIIAALGVGLGETYMWPRLVIVFGPEIRWLSTVGLLIQIFVTAEIARWTYLTGESIFQAGYRLHPLIAWFWLIVATLVYIWPGHVAFGAWALQQAFKSKTSLLYWQLGAFIIIPIILTVAPYQVYKTVKTILTLAIAIMTAVGLGVAVAATAKAGRNIFWWYSFKGSFWFGYWPEAISKNPKLWLPLIVGSIAFMGPSGMQQMWYTLFAREEGSGMSAYMPKITGLIFGREEKWREAGFLSDLSDPEEMRKWKAWRKLNVYDAAISFGLITFLVTLFYTTLAQGASELSPAVKEAMLKGKRDAAILGMGDVFAFLWGPLRFLWLFTVGIVGWKMSFGIFDAFSRGQADMTMILIPQARKIGMRKLYYIWLWLASLGGVIVILYYGGAKNPSFILDVLAFMSSFVMGAYC